MKNLKRYITEKLKITKDNIKYKHNYFPETRKELDYIIEQLIKERGNNADLNDIDVSKITDMRGLFAWRNDLLDFKYSTKYDFSKFNGDISNWNVSKVTSMKEMFEYSMFNGDISNWDVSNVTDMFGMFYQSKFNSDISKWDVSNVTNMRSMFMCSRFNSDISKWDVSNVTDMLGMFSSSKFNSDISNWVLNEKCNTYNMLNCPLKDQSEKWPQNYKK